MDDMIQALREKIGTLGDLHLTKTHAEHLIRWIEIVTKQLQDQAAVINSLKLELEFHILQMSEVHEKMNNPES